MSFLSPMSAYGLLGLAALTVFAFAAGYGLLFLLDFPDDRRNRFILSPVAITVLWALTGDLLVRLGLTMAFVTPPLWVVSFALAFIGAWAMLRDKPSAIDGTMVALGLGASVIATFTLFQNVRPGLFAHIGSLNHDTFLYTTFAVGYWQFGIALDSNASWFFSMFGAFYDSLAGGRNHTFVLLAFLSPLVEAGEPMFVRNLFVCWTVFTTCLCAVYYHRASSGSTSTSPLLSLTYVWLVAAVGWAYVPAAVGNWDNALFVGIPALLAALSFERDSRKLAVAIGVASAYGLLTYPELFPIAAVVVAPYYLLRVWNSGRPLVALMWTYAQALLVAVLVLAPAGWSVWIYLSRQLAAGASQVSRPGGNFSGGLVPRWWDPSAWWGFGAEHLFPVSTWNVTLSGVLTLLALTGFAHAIRNPKHPRLWAALATLAMTSYVLGVQHYAYGVYKILSVTWWLIAQLTMEGAETVWQQALAGVSSFARSVRMAAAAAVLTLMLVSASTAAATRRWTDYSPEPYRPLMPTLDALETLRDRALLHAPGDALITGKLLSGHSLPWLLYTFRSTPIRLYLGGQTPFPLFNSIVWNGKGRPAMTLRATDEGTATEVPIIDTPLVALIDGRIR